MFERQKDFLVEMSKTRINPRVSSLGIPSGVPTGEEQKRIAPVELEKKYAFDPEIFNGVNLYVRTMLASKPEIDTSNDKEAKYMKDWREMVRLDSFVLPKVVQHVCIYGNSWQEIVLDKKTHTEIVKLDARDPKYMDFSRRSDNSIDYDKYGHPKYYVEYLKWNIPQQKDEIVQAGQRAIKFNQDELWHGVLYTVGDSFNGIGLVEPLYNTSIRHEIAEDGLGEYLARLGHPIIGAKVGGGTGNVFPTKPIVDEVAKMFREIDPKSGLAYPDYVEINVIEPKNAATIHKPLEYFTKKKIAGLGAPGPLVTGSGERTNRSTLEKQLIMFERTLKMIKLQISMTLETQVFAFIAEQQNFDEIPKLRWEEVDNESLNEKCERITRYVSSKVLTPDIDLENLVRKWEGLPTKKSRDTDTVEE